MLFLVAFGGKRYVHTRRSASWTTPNTVADLGSCQETAEPSGWLPAARLVGPRRGAGNSVQTQEVGMAAKPPNQGHGRTQIVPAGHIPVSEFAAEVQGGLSPFGEDVQLPLPVDALTYRHPSAAERPRLPVDDEA
jgi:hypothetical protein